MVLLRKMDGSLRIAPNSRWENQSVVVGLSMLVNVCNDPPLYVLCFVYVYVCDLDG